MKRREKHEEKSEKQNQKDGCRNDACLDSLLTLFGGVSSEGIATCAEVVIENEM